MSRNRNYQNYYNKNNETETVELSYDNKVEEVQTKAVPEEPKKEEAPVEATPTPEEYKKAKVKGAAKVNFRLTPSKTGPIITVLKEGSDVRVMDTTNPEWTKIAVGNKQGYIMSKFLQIGE